MKHVILTYTTLIPCQYSANVSRPSLLNMARWFHQDRYLRAQALVPTQKYWSGEVALTSASCKLISTARLIW